MKGVVLSIYKNPIFAHSSLGGISEHCNAVTLIGAWTPCDKGEKQFVPVDGPVFEPSEQAPAVVFDHVITSRVSWNLKPADPETGGVLPGWWMCGGTFAHTSDSRMKVVDDIPYAAISLHDRQETARETQEISL